MSSKPYVYKDITQQYEEARAASLIQEKPHSWLGIPLDDCLALIGFAFLLAGIYMLLGLAITFIVLGLTLIYAGARLDIGRSHEPDKATNPQ